MSDEFDKANDAAPNAATNTAEGDGVMRFKLRRAEVPVELEDPETGKVEQYVLKELTGTGRDRYLNDLAGRMRIGQDGKPKGVKNFDGMQAGLIGRALYDSEGQLVPVKKIQEFPSSVQSALFDKVQEISGLKSESEDEAKND